ncbi:hypothetical protein KAR48_17790 [bacterium]|nr:hypothetical protein [bacterium]
MKIKFSLVFLIIFNIPLFYCSLNKTISLSGVAIESHSEGIVEELTPKTDVILFFRNESSSVKGCIILVKADGVFIRNKDGDTIFYNWLEIKKVVIERRCDLNIFKIYYVLMALSIGYLLLYMLAQSNIPAI